jgi:F0F1-type ATP synthase epsilon subunit
MALTALETISQKLQEERDNRLESILISSGSAAIAKNEYNVTIVDNKNVASSLVFKELNKDKYDEEEIKKAIAALEILAEDGDEDAKKGIKALKILLN